MPQQDIAKTIREQIVDRLRDEVMAGEFKAGQPLREITLAERFGVSRGPVRDALLQLTQEGLLIYQPNSGVRISEEPKNGGRGLVVQLRREFESHTIQSGFDRITNADRKRLGDILQALRLACEAGDIKGITEHDIAFHQAIIEATGFSDLLTLWRMLCAKMRFTYTRLDDNMNIYAEHLAILEAFDAGDKKTMISKLEENIQ